MLTAEQQNALGRVLSESRMGTYLAAAGHDWNKAWRLYVWNAKLGEAFHLPIQTVEVCLRNSLCRVFTGQYGPDWGTAKGFSDILDEKLAGDLETVKKRLRNRGVPIVNGQIVAGLSFGFWVGMLQPRYNPPIWGANLRVAFPHLPAEVDRDKASQRFKEIAKLRNRISHHEPIISRNVSVDFSNIMSAIDWMCPHTSGLIKPECRVSTVMRERPR